MKAKKSFLILLVFLASMSFSGCQNESDNGSDNPYTLEEELPVMTIREVSENNGLDGSDSYIIIDDIVYDVTGSDAWIDGNHNGNQAGQDLTEELKNDAPHGVEKLDNVVAIGRVEE